MQGETKKKNFNRALGEGRRGGGKGGRREGGKEREIRIPLPVSLQASSHFACLRMDCPKEAAFFIEGSASLVSVT
jgi:hypothetical protein